MPIGTDKPSPKRIGKQGTHCEWQKHLEPWAHRNANKRTRKAMKKETQETINIDSLEFTAQGPMKMRYAIIDGIGPIDLGPHSEGGESYTLHFPKTAK